MIYIRSQNKRSFTEALAVYMSDEAENRILADPGAFIIGKYATYERCLEIIDEIQALIHPAQEKVGTPFYQMPAE